MKELFAIIKNQPIKLQMVVFCCKIRNAIWGYPGFRATMQRHHMGISGIQSKQFHAPYGVSRARWVNKICQDNVLIRFVLALKVSYSILTIGTLGFNLVQAKL